LDNAKQEIVQIDGLGGRKLWKRKADWGDC